MLQSLLYQAEHFHGEQCGGVALGARIVEHWRSSYLDFAEAPGTTVCVPNNSGCFIDAMIALVGATPGRATLQVHDRNSVVFIKHDVRYDYALCEPGHLWPAWSDMNVEQIVALPDSALFSVSVHP
jgi:formylmethanofuran dehydrogenase subunit E